MSGSSFNNVVIRGVSLDDNLPSFNPPPSPTRNLTQELESALATSEIGKIQASIRIDYPSQRYLRQV